MNKPSTKTVKITDEAHKILEKIEQKKHWSLWFIVSKAVIIYGKLLKI